jgi:hypothetical protein
LTAAQRDSLSTFTLKNVEFVCEPLIMRPHRLQHAGLARYPSSVQA